MAGLQIEVTQMASLEQGLAATLTQTSRQVAHSECFDLEQRAEVYTILEALRSNSETHLAMVGQLAARMKASKGDA